MYPIEFVLLRTHNVNFEQKKVYARNPNFKYTQINFEVGLNYRSVLALFITNCAVTNMPDIRMRSIVLKLLVNVLG